MLDHVEDYLLQRITPERTRIFIEALQLIHSYEVTSPIESITEVVSLQDTYSNEEAMGLIESIIVNTLREILANLYIITSGDLLQQLNLLKGLNLLEHYIDSDVIVTEFDESKPTQEMLLKFLEIVSNQSIEYFDSFIMDVRPKLIERLVESHQEQVDAIVENNEDGVEASKLEVVKSFAEHHPHALGIKMVKSGLISLDMDLELLLNLTRQDIYKLEKPGDIAEAIFSLVLVSNTKHIEVPKVTMDVVNRLYDDIMLIGELKYLVTSLI